MTRARAAWLAAAVAVLVAAAYLVRRRSRSAEPVPPPAPVRPPVPPPLPVHVAAAPTPLTEEAVITEPATQTLDPVDAVERPLPTWVRVAIVVVALLAFFAVSLIATKQV